MPDGSPATFTGQIDRIDRLPSGGIEVIDYKTGRQLAEERPGEPAAVDLRPRLPRRAGAGTPEKVTLYFTEAATRMSTTRTDEQLDAARDELGVGRPRPIRRLRRHTRQQRVLAL